MTEDVTDEPVRSYWRRVWLERDLDALEDVVQDTVIRHTSEGTHTLSRAQFRTLLANGLEAICATDVRVDALAALPNEVFARVTLVGVSLSGTTPISVTWLAQYRIQQGRIAEIWSLHQAGVDWAE